MHADDPEDTQGLCFPDPADADRAHGGLERYAALRTIPQ